MKMTSKRVWSGLMAVAMACTIVPLLTASPASAVGAPQPGGASVRTAGGAAALASGNSGTDFTLRLPVGAACGGDSANDQYRVQSYMVPASVDPSTLTFGAGGPLPSGVGANYRQPLFDTLGSSYVNAQTANATTPPGPGPIINIPDFDYAVFTPGDIPPGAYNLGIACTQGAAGPTQMKEFWNVQKTFTTNGGDGLANVNWAVGAAPVAPVLTTVTPGDSTLTAAFTHSASSPASNYTATATPQAGDVDCTGGPVTSASQTTTAPIVVSGLINACTYNVAVTANNGVGSPAVSNSIAGTPTAAPRPAVQNLTATPGPGGSGSVLVDWDAPTGPAPTGYTVAVSPAVAGSPFTVPAGTTQQNVTGLTEGTLYTFTVTPTHTAPFVGTPASVQASPASSRVVQQDLTVVRPQGALVLTQRCGVLGALDLEAAQPGFPAGFTAAPESGPPGVGGTAPTTGAAPGGPADPNFAEYPYPVDANEVPNPIYPTHCNVGLGIAKFVTGGPGRGQFFAASGRLNQVTIVDTRDGDIGWTANGTMGTFTSGPNTFSGSQLGWTPKKTDDSASFTDSDGVVYDQAVTAGPGVAPNTPNATGLSSGRQLGSALAGSGLGTGVLDARLKLLIPVTKKAGTYTGILSLTAI